MIKINLLPQKRAKRSAAAASSSTDGGTKQFMLGMGGLAAAGAVVFLLVDMPLRSDRSDYEKKTAQLRGEIDTKKKKLEGYDTLKAEEASAVAKIQSINRLLTAKVVPANVLHELGEVMNGVRTESNKTCTLNNTWLSGCPTMTAAMLKAVENDPNKRIQPDWDPQHVWLTGFIDQGGVFKLEGGAQSKEDVTQLSKRLAASVYFEAVTPQSGDRVSDKDSGLSYYKFTITGKVAY